MKNFLVLLSLKTTRKNRTSLNNRTIKRFSYKNLILLRKSTNFEIGAINLILGVSLTVLGVNSLSYCNF
jgi:hypothetical protein